MPVCVFSSHNHFLGNQPGTPYAVGKCPTKWLMSNLGETRIDELLQLNSYARSLGQLKSISSTILQIGHEPRSGQVWPSNVRICSQS